MYVHTHLFDWAQVRADFWEISHYTCSSYLLFHYFFIFFFNFEEVYAFYLLLSLLILFTLHAGRHKLFLITSNTGSNWKIKCRCVCVCWSLCVCVWVINHFCWRLLHFIWDFDVFFIIFLWRSSEFVRHECNHV